MKIISGAIVAWVVCVAVVGASDVRAQEAAEHASPDVVAVGNLGKRLVEWAQAAQSVGFSGAVLAARDGEIVASFGVGSADADGLVPITPTTLFEIASATKQFTAAAVLRLAEDGALQLDDPISKHLPGIPADCAAITVRHLLQHTSGISGRNSMGAGDDVEAVLPFFLKGGPLHPPGTHYEYWNQGYSLLSEIVARASGQDYTTYCTEQLFAPASMVSTCFTGDKPPPGVSVAIGTSAGMPSRSALEHPYGAYGLQYRGMGGVVTNVEDLWRWDRALHGDTPLGEASRELLFTPGLSDYALGWFVKNTASGRRVQSHTGSVRGFTADLRRFPDQDGCLFVLCNSTNPSASRIAPALEEILFDEPPTIQLPPRPLTPGLQADLPGLYKDERGNELTIDTADGPVTRVRIAWSPPKGPVSRATLGLDAEGGVVYYEWKHAYPFGVTRNEAGTVTSVTSLDREYVRE